MSESNTSFLSGRLLARNAVWNFGGLAVPMLVALFVIPLLITGFGKERFGLLAIIWMGVGYFSLFDMGFGRGLTKLVAEQLGGGRDEDLGSLVWSALPFVFIFGVAGAAAVAMSAGALVHHVLNVEAEIQAEGIIALRVLAIGLPLVVVTSALIGLLEAHQRFATIMAVRAPLGVTTFGAPLLTSLFTQSLVWATFALIVCRFLAFIAYFLAAASVRPELKYPERPRRKHIQPLLQFGGWLTVTNVVGPLMVYFDRFLIGAIMTMTAVTYYVTPYEVLSRVQLLPRSIVGVLFPALTTAMTADRRRLSEIYSQSSRILLLLMLPLMSALFFLAPEGLEVWLGGDFRQQASTAAQWLACGYLINTLARMPFTVLQSAGRPDLVAKTHFLELIPYLVLLWVLTQKYGIAGTAAAWFLRVLADTLILNWLTYRTLPELSRTVARTLSWIVVILVGFGLGSLVGPLLLRGLFLIAVGAASAVFLWPVLRSLTKTGIKAPVDETE